MRARRIALAAAVTVLAACSSGGTSASSTTAPGTTAAATSTTAAPPATSTTTTAATTTTAPPPTTTAAPSGPRAFSVPGPYPVGVLETTLPGGRPVTVWYPAQPGSEQGKPKATYDMRSFLPAAEVPKVADVPAAQTSFTMNAYAGLPPASGGPFPLVLFSHGLAGYRTQSSFLTTTMASWGMVVASPQHRSRDLEAILSGTSGQGQPGDVQDLEDTITLMDTATKGASGALAGLVDTGRIAAVGHSAGGGAVFRLAAADPRITTYVALAAGGGSQSSTAVPTQPSLFVAGSSDVIASLDRVEKSWNDVVRSPKRLAVLDGVTHLGFMDVCTIAANDGGVIALAKSKGVTVADLVVRLFADGCDAKYTAATDAWPAIEHLTIAQVRNGLGIDKEPVGLDASVETAFAPMAVRFQQG